MKTNRIPTLLTERLRLRGFRRSDFEEYAALKADREVLRYLVGAGTEPWDLGRSWRHLAFLVGHWQLAGFGMWAVEERETRTFVGLVGFAKQEGWADLERCWTLSRRWWGNGYATEGARAALGHAVSVWQKDRLISLIHPDNRASICVAERIGERFLRRSQLLGQEMLCYGIDRESYLGQRWQARLTREALLAS